MVLVAGGSPRPLAAAACLAVVVIVTGGRGVFSAHWRTLTGTVTLVLTPHFAASLNGDTCHALPGAATRCGQGFQSVDNVTCCPLTLAKDASYYSTSCGSSCLGGFLSINGPADIAADAAGPCDHFCYQLGRCRYRRLDVAGHEYRAPSVPWRRLSSRALRPHQFLLAERLFWMPRRLRRVQKLPLPGANVQGWRRRGPPGVFQYLHSA